MAATMNANHACAPNKPLQYPLGKPVEVPFRGVLDANGDTTFTFALPNGYAQVLDLIVDRAELVGGTPADLSLKAVSYDDQPYFPRTRDGSTSANVELAGFDVSAFSRESVYDYGCCGDGRSGMGKMDSPGSASAAIMRHIGPIEQEKLLVLTFNNADSANDGYVAGSIVIMRTS